MRRCGTDGYARAAHAYFCARCTHGYSPAAYANTYRVPNERP